MSYTPPSISGYNSAPPSDDGAQTSANRLYWSTIKTKLSDPLKNYIDAINTAVDNGFNNQFMSTIDDKSSTFTVGTADDGRFYNCTSALTVNLPPASSVGEGFHIAVFNNSVGTITIDGDSSETINGSATATITVQYEAIFLICTGSGWFATYLALPARFVTSITGNLSVGGTLSATGTFTVNGTSTASATISLAEDTDNGSNKVTITPPQSIAADYTLTLPASAGTLQLLTDSKRILKHSYDTNTTATSTATAIPADNTIPQSTEGAEGMTASFTPTSATSKLCIWYGAMLGSSSASTSGVLCLFKDSDAGALDATPAYISNGGVNEVNGYYEMTSGTTSAITFKLRYGAASGTTYFNSLSGTGLYGGVAPAFIKIVEVEA